MAEHGEEELEGVAMEGSTLSDVGVAGEDVPSSILEGGVSSAVLSNGGGQGDAAGEEVEMTPLPPAEGVGGGSDSVELHGAAVLQEPCVIFVVKDVTKSDWQKSRYTYSLSQSSAVVDLYAAIGKESGMIVLCMYYVLLQWVFPLRLRGGLLPASLGCRGHP